MVRCVRSNAGDHLHIRLRDLRPSLRLRCACRSLCHTASDGCVSIGLAHGPPLRPRTRLLLRHSSARATILLGGDGTSTMQERTCHLAARLPAGRTVHRETASRVTWPATLAPTAAPTSGALFWPDVQPRSRVTITVATVGTVTPQSRRCQRPRPLPPASWQGRSVVPYCVRRVHRALAAAAAARAPVTMRAWISIRDRSRLRASSRLRPQVSHASGRKAAAGASTGPS